MMGEGHLVEELMQHRARRSAPNVRCVVEASGDHAVAGWKDRRGADAHTNGMPPEGAQALAGGQVPNGGQTCQVGRPPSEEPVTEWEHLDLRGTARPQDRCGQARLGVPDNAVPVVAASHDSIAPRKDSCTVEHVPAVHEPQDQAARFGVPDYGRAVLAPSQDVSHFREEAHAKDCVRMGLQREPRPPGAPQGHRPRLRARCNGVAEGTYS
mmetsp:Transcript_128793/g.372647  ORF Transcript_128793/g.372647 Transcript_128793/m.372647 type:complete len:211 (+) Transcript_128793:83-715(+)